MKATDIPGVSAGQLNLSAVTRLEDGLEIEFNSSASFQLPYLFLRDSCETCFERRSGRRLFSVAGELSEVRAEDAGIVRRKGFNGLLVLWEGGMQSTFEASWLLDKCVALDSGSTRLPCRVWGCAEMADSIASFNFREVLGADRAQLHLLEALVERDGIALIRGAPPRQSSLRDLGHRVFASSTLARTFQIEIDADDRSSSDGHIRGARALHSELAYCEDSPGIMAMLCVRLKTANADEIAGERPEDADWGGKLMLVDGLMLARNMEHVFPQEYHILAKTMVSFRKSSFSQNDLCELRASRPVFTLDCDGAMKRICVDEEHRTRWEGDPSSGGQWLGAFRTMTGLLYSEGLVVSQTFKVGDILLLDSQRVLWGQTPFRAGSGWLSACEGGFFSRDEALSRTHLLRRLMNNTREFDL